MEYEVVKNITLEHLARIQKEQQRSFNKDSVRIVKVDGKEIGFYVFFFICGRLTLEYYLFREYQHLGYGKKFVEIVTEAAGLEYSNHSTLYLLIYNNNIASMNVALANGYSTSCSDFEFYEIVSSETPDYYIYAKANKHYKDEDKQKIKNKIPESKIG